VDRAAISPAAAVSDSVAAPKQESRGRFGALTYRDYRLVFFGQVVSSTGGWMQMVAQGWLVYQLTGSPFYLGLIGLARAVPAFLFALVGGAVADRYDRRVIMGVANGAICILALILGLLTISGLVAVWHVVIIAFFMGTAFSFEMPSRNSLISHIVGPKDVVSAVGLNSVAFNTAQVVGPALAAVLIIQIGAGNVFLLNSAGYLTVIAAALLLRPTPRATSGSGSLLSNIVDGLRYVRRMPELLALVSLAALISLLARPYLHLLPAFAEDVLQVGAGGLGALNSASGIGALVGAVVVAGWGGRHRGLMICATAAGFGGMLVLFGLSTSYFVSLTAALALGLLSSYTGISSNTVLQTRSDARMRGRVLSLHGLTMMGVVPLGVMLEGALGSLLGVQLVAALGGALTVISAIAVLILVPRLRRLD
jgi:hypothetical protein